MKKTIIALLTASLMACGGSGSDSTDSVNGSNQAPQLSDLVGVWDESYLIEGEEDVFYTVIRDNGTLGSYDYLGDEYDQGPKCYDNSFSDLFILTDLGQGQFSMSVDDFVLQEGYSYSAEHISQYNFNDANTLEIKAISSNETLTYDSEIVYSFKLTVVDENKVSFEIFEDEQDFTVNLSRQNSEDEWNVDSGYYHYLEDLYWEATFSTQTSIATRSEYTESDFTPLCIDMSQVIPRQQQIQKKQIQTMSKIQKRFDSLGNYIK